MVPGAVNTELLVAYHRRLAKQEGVSYETVRQRAAAGAPLNQILQPEEVADVLVYLPSERSGGVHGQSIDVTAGSWMT